MGAVLRFELDGAWCAARIFADQSLVSHSGTAAFQAEAFRVSSYALLLCCSSWFVFCAPVARFVCGASSMLIFAAVAVFRRTNAGGYVRFAVPLHLGDL